MANLYKKAKAIAGVEDQWMWLNSRNTCDSVECLHKSYADRIADLDKVINASQSQDLPAKPSEPTKEEVTQAAPLDTSNKAVEFKESMPQELESSSANQNSAPLHGQSPSESKYASPSQVLLVLLAAFGVGAWYAFSHRCPSCEKWLAAKESGKDLIDRGISHEMVKTDDEHRDASGKIIGTTTRQQQISVVTSTYRVHHRCRYCGHEWSTIKTSKS